MQTRELNSLTGPNSGDQRVGLLGLADHDINYWQLVSAQVEMFVSHYYLLHSLAGG